MEPGQRTAHRLNKDPALAAGWAVMKGSQIRREYLIPPGRIEGRTAGQGR